VLLPTLRVGFVVAPGSLVPSLRAAKGIADSHGPLETQRALAALIDDGSFARHVRRVARVYGERRDALVSAVERHLGLEVLPSSAGLHVTVLLRRMDATLLPRALEAGVRVEALAAYCAYQTARPRAGLALGYGVIPAEKIDEGIRRLAGALSPRAGLRQRAKVTA
jgi:GntR family transcriptional regulator/MocR family aminotransferase